MITLKVTVANSICKYPLLYKDINFKYSKAKVLNHLFFVNGNGYKWVNGGLFNGIPIRYDSIPENYFVTDIVDESGFECSSKSALGIYPICKYANILSLPNDIKKDWLKGAEEALKLARDYYNDPYKHCNSMYMIEWIHTRNYKAIQKYLREQKKFLDKAEKRINILRNTNNDK